MRQNSLYMVRTMACCGVVMLLLGVTSVEAQSGDYHYSVRGRVVDSKGKPIPGAIVYLDPVPGADQIFGATADASGSFHLEESTPHPRHVRRLYVTAPPPSEAATLI